jgi:hypothetical protein
MRRGSFHVKTLRSRSSALLRVVTRADHRRDPCADVRFRCFGGIATSCNNTRRRAERVAANRTPRCRTVLAGRGAQNCIGWTRAGRIATAVRRIRGPSRARRRLQVSARELGERSSAREHDSCSESSDHHLRNERTHECLQLFRLPPSRRHGPLRGIRWLHGQRLAIQRLEHGERKRRCHGQRRKRNERNNDDSRNRCVGLRYNSRRPNRLRQDERSTDATCSCIRAATSAHGRHHAEYVRRRDDGQAT